MVKGKRQTNISIYHGELGFDGQQQNGRGKSVFIQGYTREGDWKDDHMHGVCTETLFGETNVAAFERNLPSKIIKKWAEPSSNWLMKTHQSLLGLQPLGHYRVM